MVTVGRRPAVSRRLEGDGGASRGAGRRGREPCRDRGDGSGCGGRHRTGALTSVLQGRLGPLDPLVNSAGSWCVVAALLASRTRRPVLAVSIGVLTLWSLLGGYLLATEMRDLSMSQTFVLFWVACGAVGGPVVGLAGSWLRHHGAWRASLAVTALAGLLLGEAIYGLTVVVETTGVVYWVLEAVVGLAVTGGMGRGAPTRCPNGSPGGGRHRRRGHLFLLMASRCRSPRPKQPMTLAAPTCTRRAGAGPSTARAAEAGPTRGRCGSAREVARRRSVCTKRAGVPGEECDLRRRRRRDEWG